MNVTKASMDLRKQSRAIENSAQRYSEKLCKDIFNCETENEIIDNVRLYIERGAKLNYQFDYDGNTALIWATYRNFEKIAKILVNAGADVNKLNKDNCSPLIWASINGNVKLTKLFIESGANINKQDKQHNTALNYAYFKEHKEIQQLLLAEKAKIETKYVKAQNAYQSSTK